MTPRSAGHLHVRQLVCDPLSLTDMTTTRLAAAFAFIASVAAHGQAIREAEPQKFDRTIGICHLSENPFDPTSAVNSMSPALAIKNYFRVQEHRKIGGQANYRVLRAPVHGTLLGPENDGFVYYPENGFFGNDRASILVELSNKKIRVEYFFRVMTSIPQQYESEPDIYEQGYCPKKARVWKISSNGLWFKFVA